MIVLLRWLQYTSVKRDCGSPASVLAMMDRIGVMPEPAANPTRWRAPATRGLKRPSGGITSSVTPARKLSTAQRENSPPSIGLMPTSISPAAS